MRRLAWVVGFVAVAVAPAAGSGQYQRQPGVATQPLVPSISPGDGGNPLPGPANYKAPKADGPVVELLDEGVEPLFPLLNNDNGSQPGAVTREDRDVFAGVEATRVTPVQKYGRTLPGWNYKIVADPKAAPGPKAAGEYRYLRMAWKKIGGTGIMIQLHSPDTTAWNRRFYAGKNTVGWEPAKRVSDKIPAEWEVVTRDLFKEFGTFTLDGFALTAMDGTAALFDHILLGRTVEDLDKATEAALGKVKPAAPLAGKERDALWTDLLGADPAKAAAALQAFLATAPDQVSYIKERLGDKTQPTDLTARIRRLVADLDADDFDVREAATDELVKISEPAIEAVRALAAGGAPNDEVRYRAKLILKRLDAGGAPLTAAGRMARVVRVLERAGTKDASDLLFRMGDGEFGPDAAADARAAYSRLPRLP
jgi:hypothetical protein